MPIGIGKTRPGSTVLAQNFTVESLVCLIVSFPAGRLAGFFLQEFPSRSAHPKDACTL